MTIAWGASIEVAGRPTWLKDHDMIAIVSKDGYVQEASADKFVGSDYDWWLPEAGDDRIVSIRLPAGHPYYGAPSWRTSDEQLDRMDALILRLAQMTPEAGNFTLQRACIEAAAIIVDRKPTNPRFDKVMNVLLTNSTVVANDAGLRRLTRDVLAALDA